MGNREGSGKDGFLSLVPEEVCLDLELDLELAEVVLEQCFRKVGVNCLNRLVREWPQRWVVVSVA